jgi:beta-phosphoglucomutase
LDLGLWTIRSMIKAIFFDFNGVIIDDERLQMQAYQELLRDYSIDLTEEDYFGALGMDDKTFVRSTFERANKELTDDALNTIQEGKTARHRKLIEDKLPFFPGVVTLLKATSRSFSIGLVSMANWVEIEYVLSRARLLPHFSVVVHSDLVNLCKPAPDCYRVGLEKLNEKLRDAGQPLLMSQQCLVIEDSPPGIESGKAAGMRTLGVTNTVSEEELRSAGAEVVTKSLTDWTVDTIRHVYEG